jgi:hypothetical protein
MNPNLFLPGREEGRGGLELMMKRARLQWYWLNKPVIKSQKYFPPFTQGAFMGTPLQGAAPPVGDVVFALKRGPLDRLMIYCLASTPVGDPSER